MRALPNRNIDIRHGGRTYPFRASVDRDIPDEIKDHDFLQSAIRQGYIVVMDDAVEEGGDSAISGGDNETEEGTVSKKSYRKGKR